MAHQITMWARRVVHGMDNPANYVFPYTQVLPGGFFLRGAFGRVLSMFESIFGHGVLFGHAA
jgi:hypothetical protein